MPHTIRRGSAPAGQVPRAPLTCDDRRNHGQTDKSSTRMATIYRKTAKGVLEIETRALKLAPRFRNLLILVDGRRSDDELAGLVTGTGEQALQALAEAGLIEAIGMTARIDPPEPARTAAPAPAAPRPAPAPPPPGFEARRQEAVRTLLHLVGPMGEPLALKLERARSQDEFKPLLETAAQIVINTRGRAAALEFYQRFAGE